MKKNKIKVIIALSLLLVIFIGATYAYFSSQIGGAGSSNVTLTTKTTDSLTFQTGSDITLGPVTTSTFTNGGSNVSGSTTATATLRANNNTNQASETYNVYLRINTNTFQKTSANQNGCESDPEAAYCYFVPFVCATWQNGTVYCISNDTGSSCEIQSNGAAVCID